ncbi:hypothetical protein Ctob_011980 [Chrysochromulina tobinii]|uniref:Uncharacterized protein n=1 Tax=Chrysochromulina tobinii TaxID=1460289 RepID=A0A0M0K3J0_9EUKA|nr:hypothetical protein Ctob_011980 [Chrysochromulina tobinii]|eukprot:KOO33374.1 hypothetical protein Ctob_011980 [Chrysochromulina sp. CCMP291]
MGKDAPTPKVRSDDEVVWASCWASTAVRPDALDGLGAVLGAVLGVSRAGRTPRVALGLAFSASSVAFSASSVAFSASSVAFSASSVAFSASSVAFSASSVAFSASSVAFSASLVAFSASSATLSASSATFSASSATARSRASTSVGASFLRSISTCACTCECERGTACTVSQPALRAALRAALRSTCSAGRRSASARAGASSPGPVGVMLGAMVLERPAAAAIPSASSVARASSETDSLTCGEGEAPW